MVRNTNPKSSQPINQVITAGPRTQQYVTLAAAFDFFNVRLFSGELQPCLITLQRKADPRLLHRQAVRGS